VRYISGKLITKLNYDLHQLDDKKLCGRIGKQQEMIWEKPSTQWIMKYPPILTRRKRFFENHRDREKTPFTKSPE